jgi:hypothetical protein
MNFHLRQFLGNKKNWSSVSVLAGLAHSGWLNRIEEGIKVIFFMNFHNFIRGLIKKKKEVIISGL